MLMSEFPCFVGLMGRPMLPTGNSDSLEHRYVTTQAHVDCSSSLDEAWPILYCIYCVSNSDDFFVWYFIYETNHL